MIKFFRFRNFVITNLFFWIALYGMGQVPKMEWAKAFGGSSGAASHDVIVDSLGNVYTTGYFIGTADMNPGVGVFSMTATAHSDIYVQKLDAGGNFIWAISFKGTSYVFNRGIAIDSDTSGCLLVTGEFSGTVDFDPGVGVMNKTSNGEFDAFVVKLDADGNLLWVNTYGGTSSDVASTVFADNFGNYYLGGRYYNTADFDESSGVNNLTSNGLLDMFIVKLDHMGHFIWAISQGGSETDQISAICGDEFGNIYIAGDFSGTVDFDPGLAIYQLMVTDTWDDVFVQKLDSNGNFMWAKSFSGLGSDAGTSVTYHTSGFIYLTGCFTTTVDFDPGPGFYNLTSAGGNDIFITKLTVDIGDLVWAKKIGGSSQDISFALDTDQAGNVYFTGDFSGIVDFDPGVETFNLQSPSVVYFQDNIYAEKLNANGEFVWAYSMGNTSYDESYSVDVDDSSNLYITGFFNGVVDFNPDPNPGVYNMIGTNQKIFVQKVSQCMPKYSTFPHIACNSYTWIDGVTYYTNNNTAQYRLLNGASNGCDSIIQLNLTIQPFGIYHDVHVVCDSFKWIDGITYTTSNETATYVIESGALNGCDSIVMLDLTINNSKTTIDSVIACSSYIWLDGNTYYANNNTADYHYMTASGCDSIIQLHLTIINQETGVTINGDTLTSNATGVLYQWLDCKNEFTIIPGEIMQSFIPQIGGNYAVQVTDTFNNCLDTSECIEMALNEIADVIGLGEISIYPNPSTGNVIVNFNLMDEIELLIYDLNGKSVYAKEGITDSPYCFNFDVERGTYIVEVKSRSGLNKIKLIKQ